MKTKGEYKWLAIALAGSIIEAEALKNKKHDHTLSYATRAVFRTHSKFGKLSFLAVLISVTVWFAVHIVGKENPQWSR